MIENPTWRAAQRLRKALDEAFWRLALGRDHPGEAPAVVIHAEAELRAAAMCFDDVCRKAGVDPMPQEKE